MEEGALCALADRVAIGEVLAAYCRGLDRMDLDAVAALFTEDCAVSFGSHPALQSAGREALRRDLERLWRFRRTAHHLSNLEVRAAGDSAEAVSYVMAWHERPDGSTATLFGGYEDMLRREAGGWRIARRRQFMNGADAGFAAPIHPAPRRGPPPGWAPPPGLR
ncbi:MAG: nuclear transport factor 2 family protein [Rhodobacteraceae bacterium]|jgi:ketosteroid isomerase-like protein|nr:nuclear transport factor 2 family protein [Paracoccaceae bacterium]